MPISQLGIVTVAELTDKKFICPAALDRPYPRDATGFDHRDKEFLVSHRFLCVILTFAVSASSVCGQVVESPEQTKIETRLGGELAPLRAPVAATTIDPTTSSTAKQENSTDDPKLNPEATDAVADPPKSDEPQTDQPKSDEPKSDEPKSDEPKTDEPPKPQDSPDHLGGTKSVLPVQELEANPAAPNAGEAVPQEANRLQSNQFLPSSTKAWFSIPNLSLLEEQFDKTQYGKLAEDEAIKPFVESMKEQARTWLDEKNVRLGIKVDDIEQIHTGEICLAGVLQELGGDQPARGSHGIVLLVDCTGNEEQVSKLFDRINAQLIEKREAVVEELEINGVKVKKVVVPNPKRLRHNQHSFQTIAKGWMLVADNEQIFRDVLGRISNSDVIREETMLAAQDRFTTIMENSKLFGNEAHFSWYVDPFGYLQLAQAIADEERDTRPHRDDWIRILQEQGFDAIRGMGGNISLATKEHEILNRAFIYAPRTLVLEKHQRVFDLFDFQIEGLNAPTPADWVPLDSSGYFSANWNFTKLLNNSGHVYDAFMGNEGAFKNMLIDFKADPEMQLDIPRLVGMLDNNATIISSTDRPISETSERMVIGFRLQPGVDPDYVFNSLKRAVGQNNGELIKLAGINVLEVDTTKVIADPEFEDEFQLIPGIEEPSIDEEEEDPELKFSLFQTRYFVIHKNHLLVANHKEYLKRLLTSMQKSNLSDAEDYQQIFASLAKLTDAKKICFRQFARTDLALETNYEMLRRGDMAKSQTAFARIMNKLIDSEDPPEQGAIRKQKIDASKLPEDFQKTIAPYLGPSGWVLEAEADGWRVTGCALKKKTTVEVNK